MPHVEGVGATPVFFRLMVRPKFLAASEKRLTMCCTASSVWARRARSLANSSSEMSSSIVFVRAWRRRRLKRLKTDVDAIWQVLFCLTEHAAEEDEEKCGGRDARLLDATGDGRGDVSQEFPKSITADSIKGIGQAYESCRYIYLCSVLCISPISASAQRS